MRETFGVIAGIFLGIILIFSFILLGSCARTYYKRWDAGVSIQTQERYGEGDLLRATQQRKIQIEQARAEKEASTLRAEAIKIVGEAAQKYPEYRYQEFIGAFAESLKNGSIQQIIYVPTEANIPLLEASRLKGE